MQKGVKIVPKPLVKIPAEIAVLLGEPALARGESRDKYDALLLAIARSIGSHDIIGWMWANDLACHEWEARRLQRIKASLLLESQILVIEDLLKTTYDPPNAPLALLNSVSGAKNDARSWASDPEFGRQIDDRLALRGHGRDSVLAKAYQRCSKELVALDHAIANRELRRMVTLREIARRDEAMARRMDQSAMEFEEGEFNEAAE